MGTDRAAVHTGRRPHKGPTATDAAAFACSALVATLATVAARGRPIAGKTAHKYTTQTILPSLTWFKTGFKSSDLDGGRLICICLEGVDVLIGKTGSGKPFAV